MRNIKYYIKRDYKWFLLAILILAVLFVAGVYNRLGDLGRPLSEQIVGNLKFAANDGATNQEVVTPEKSKLNKLVVEIVNTGDPFFGICRLKRWIFSKVRENLQIYNTPFKKTFFLKDGNYVFTIEDLDGDHDATPQTENVTLKNGESKKIFVLVKDKDNPSDKVESGFVVLPPADATNQ
jgi:hypothetical protein